MPAVFAWLLNWLGGGFLDRVLGHLEKRIDNETERQKINALRDQHAMTTQASVITAGMQHKMFWVAWSIAALPMAAWFGWGMLDTLFNGALPDVATIPPGLKPYADAVWQNIFYTGAAVAGATGAASIIGKAIAGRR